MATRGADGPPAAIAARDGKQTSASSVFVRIRPLSKDGDGGHTDGEAVSKKLAGWGDRTVTIQEDDLRQTRQFEFTKVVGPSVEQEEAFNVMLPELVQGFHGDTNVMFFAYGQTGSGKTHTMLGETDSLSSPVPVPGWGIFPRVVHSTLVTMKDWK
eukprot:TRINITY_DN69418_c0_g1_i1.p1 TRINITY_DN69418_c0_g1~~TRINITY_DN69418_c0_g1_i1.p1  ORF type:complete len:156 (+),score=13.85 TRINITY_DN69418_c0_g1_i1:73-540(+)